MSGLKSHSDGRESLIARLYNRGPHDQSSEWSGIRIANSFICSKAQADFPAAASAFLTNDLIGSIIVVFVGAAILVCVTRLVTARKYAPDSPAPAHLHRAGFLPVQWGELRVGYATQICGGVSFRTILSLVDVVN